MTLSPTASHLRLPSAHSQRSDRPRRDGAAAARPAACGVVESSSRGKAVDGHGSTSCERPVGVDQCASA